MVQRWTVSLWSPCRFLSEAQSLPMSSRTAVDILSRRHPAGGISRHPPRSREDRAGASCPALTRLRHHLLADGRIRRDTRTPLASARVGGPVDPSARAMTGGAVA